MSYSTLGGIYFFGLFLIRSDACNKLFPLRSTTLKFCIFTDIMSQLKHIYSGKTAITHKTDGNPEGKGLNGFILDWYQSEPSRVVAKPQRLLLAELFTSMLVLSATFKYRPVVGVENYLYRINGEWSLSLIAPDEWSNERRAGFAGACVLQRDMTWTIAPSDQVSEANPVSDAIDRFYNAFVEVLDTDRPLEEVLPFYVGRLPYYQRLYASALSRSLHAAVILGDQVSISCRQWCMLLPQPKNVLPAYRG